MKSPLKCEYTLALLRMDINEIKLIIWLGLVHKVTASEIDVKLKVKKDVSLKNKVSA